MEPLTVEVFAVGGYGEAGGRNMTAVRVDEEIVIFDCGMSLDKSLVFEKDFQKASTRELRKVKAIPNDSILRPHRSKTVAAVLSHAHLDHIGAVPKLLFKYKCPVFGTEFTIELVKADLRNEIRYADESEDIMINLYTVEPGDEVQITSKLRLEFIPISHSIPCCVLPVLHTPYGAIVYACDFKFDDNQIIGYKPDYKRLKQLGKEGVLLLITESLRVAEEIKTPSESVAREMVNDVLRFADEESEGIIVTTFSSHIERIQAIADTADRLGRKVILAGRSMGKYGRIAEELGLLNLPAGARIYDRPETIRRGLERANKEKEDYLLIVTGHQGEPGAVLPRIVDGELPYRLTEEDSVVFSSSTIPSPINRANRYVLDTKLRLKGVKMFKDVHVSGHAGREDHRLMLRMLHPEFIVPAHGDPDMLAAYAELATQEGYEVNRDVFIMFDGTKLSLPL
ncbi:RNase J family beta-CASP ribonuclease [Methanopyrus sp. KOL6]|uniref:RNase J family beta-CASP ribonuclease n=1 Tax=Methanopyrus sp. KOL6 TaxID=1937004 RepID=UPI000B4BE0E4|nr:RNase J family beta-CASP ribonuclease [Methanopyrus sp. KOL6]